MSLENAGVSCNHTNHTLFDQQAIQTMLPHISHRYEQNYGHICEEPVSCSATLPPFTCAYDDSACVENIILDCAQQSYVCAITGDK